MPYTNDMATLAQIVGPAYAAQQAGIQNDAANQIEQAKAQVAQGTVPAEIQKAQLANQLTGAQAYAEQGLGMQNQAKGLADLYAAPSAAQAAVAGNQTKITGAHLDQLEQLGQIVGGIAQRMQGVPPPMRPAYMGQILDEFNVQNPAVRQLVANGDPDQLMQLSQGMTQGSANYRLQMLKGSQEAASAANVATISGASHVQGAREAAGARQYAADVNAQVKQATAGLGALQQQLYNKVASGTATPQERAALDSINQVQQLTRQGSPFQAAITGTQVPSNVPPVPGGGVPNATQGAPAIGNPEAGGSPDQAALIEEARRRGLIK